MNSLKDIWPLFAIVIILGSVVGANVLKSRPSAGEILEIHNEMKAERDSFMTYFQEMAFNAEVLGNRTFVRKYPMPDVRYQLSIKNKEAFQKPEELGPVTPLYDFSNAEASVLWTALDGKFIGKGDLVKKDKGASFYLVQKKNGDIDTMNLEWRLFIQEELYEE